MFIVPLIDISKFLAIGGSLKIKESKMNKKVLRTKEPSDPTASSTLDDDNDISSSDEEQMDRAALARQQARQGGTLNSSQYNPTGSDKKKCRIPWDRNPHGDKNGLKFALLSLINDYNYHVEGMLMNNFKEVANILSRPGSKFEKYEGIEPSGAQRKFNSILREIAASYFRNGEFVGEENAEGFEQIGIKMLKDIIAKEKAKFSNTGGKSSRAQQLLDGEDLGLSTSNASVEDIDNAEAMLSASFLKKRKAEITPLKHELKRVAVAGMIPEDPDEIHDRGINRLDVETHHRVVAELQKMNILTVGDLLKAADVSDHGIESFTNTTQVKLTKPVDRILKLYEEVAVAKDFVSKMQFLCGLNAGDALEFESFVKPLYTANRA